MVLSILSALTPASQPKSNIFQTWVAQINFRGKSCRIRSSWYLPGIPRYNLPAGGQNCANSGLLHRIQNSPQDLGIYGVEFIKPGAIHVRFAPVPAEVMVVRNRIRNPQILGIHGTIGQSCQRGQSGFVQLVAQIIEQSVISSRSGPPRRSW